MVGSDDGCDCARKWPVVDATGAERVDEILGALADTNRRYALYYLSEVERAPLREVAAAVAACEHGVDVEEVPESAVDPVEAALYHRHLPRLREACVVEYDDRSGTVVFRDPHPLVETCLDHCEPRDLPEEPPFG